MNENLLLQIILLVVGFVLLIKGADFFVDGASNIAKALKIPSIIVGLTLVSIGTSLPEASVSVQSAIKGSVDISIGNVVGSDIFNTLFILGVSSIIIPLVISKDMRVFDIPIMVATYLILLLFSYVITPNVIQRWEAIIMLLLYIGYVVFLILRTKKNSFDEYPEINTTDCKKTKPIWLSILLTVVGLAGVVLGGTLTVNSAQNIALKLGMSETLVGLTIVAIGTSLPELVTSIVAAIKKEDDIAVGNVVGSNIFNIVGILGVSALINPLVITTSSTLIDMIVMLVTGVILLLIALLSKKIKRWQGITIFLLYIMYMIYIIIRN